jgi:hypothetical protein
MAGRGERLVAGVGAALDDAPVNVDHARLRTVIEDLAGPTDAAGDRDAVTAFRTAR